MIYTDATRVESSTGIAAERIPTNLSGSIKNIYQVRGRDHVAYRRTTIAPIVANRALEAFGINGEFIKNKA
jgi:hypothetical protein